MIKLNNPVHTELDEGYFIDIVDFRGYARSMMYPDPVAVVMSDELNDLVTDAVNKGKITLNDAFDKLTKRNARGYIDYEYSDGTDGNLPGRELLCFYDISVAKKLFSEQET